MADQTIPDSGVTIKNVVPAQWQKGQCPPDWNDNAYTTEYSEEYK